MSINDEIWKTANGHELKVCDMSDSHAKNALNLILKNRRLRDEETMDFTYPEGCDRYGSLE